MTNGNLVWRLNKEKKELQNSLLLSDVTPFRLISLYRSFGEIFPIYMVEKPLSLPVDLSVLKTKSRG
jgi:hypothetical protein